MLAALAIPAGTGLCVLVGLYAAPGRGRDLAVALPAAGVVGMALAVGLTYLRRHIAAAPERAAHARQAAEHEARRHQEYYQQRLAQLQALPADAPVYQFIQFTYANEPGDIAAQARALILARPRFVADLADALCGKACYEGMWFLATGIDRPPPELAEPARDGILRIAEHIRGQLLAPGMHYADQYFGEISRILVVVGKFEGAGVDFAPALEHLMQSLSVPPAREAERGARSLISDWLERRRPPAGAHRA